MLKLETDDYSNWPIPRLKKVVLFSMPRTGSTMVTRQLSTHPQIFFTGALFSVRGWGPTRGRNRLMHGLSLEWNDLTFRIKHREKLLQRLYSIAGERGCAGLKHHLSGAREVTESLLADRELGKIILTRNNILASFSSDKATKININTANTFDSRKIISFDEKEFENYLVRRSKIYERWKLTIAAGDGPWMEIDYCEARTRAGIGRIVEFIGLDPERISQQRTIKRNPDDVASRFQNSAEVRSYLLRNGLEAWLEERSLNEMEVEHEHSSTERQLADLIGERRAARRAERVEARKSKRLRLRKAEAAQLQSPETQGKLED